MKLFTSVFAIAAILATGNAFITTELDSILSMLDSGFQQVSFDSYFGYTSPYQYDLEQQFNAMYPEGSATAGQKAAMDYVVKTKNCYKDVFASINDTTNNYKAWAVGNFTQYNAVFKSLLSDFDTAIQAGIQQMKGRAGCGASDAENVKWTLISPAYTIYSVSSTNNMNNFMYLYSMVGQSLMSSFQTSFSTFLYDSDPMASIKQSEVGVIYPNQKLMLAEITNVGNTILTMITKGLDGQVANAKYGIANIPNIVASVQCTGY